MYCCHSLNQNKILTKSKYALQNIRKTKENSLEKWPATLGNDKRMQHIKN
jgi:hypothetical protein